MDVDTDSPFSADYVTARRRIREAASRLGCETQAYSIGARGPHEEDLTIDVVITPGTSRGSHAGAVERNPRSRRVFWFGSPTRCARGLDQE